MSHHDNRPVGWVNPNTGVTYTRNLEFLSVLDNYDPPRSTSRSLLEEWVGPDGTITYRLVGWQSERDATNAVYLLDDGRTVRPFYVAGWSPDSDHILLHAFPTNYRPDGERKIRDDNGRPVDHGPWALGPRRAYHLKITEG